MDSSSTPKTPLAWSTRWKPSGREFKIIEESHGRNVLNLVMVVSYLRRLLDNARVVRFLSQSHPEILTEFQKLVEAKNLGEAAAVE